MRLRYGAELLPDACAVELDGLHADAQRLGDLARQLAGEHMFHHFAFSPGQRCQSRAEIAAGCTCRRHFPLLTALLRVGVQRVGDGQHQALFLVRLLDEVDGAAFQRAHGERHVAVPGQEDDRDRVAALVQFILQVETAHARHADVEEQATGALRPIDVEKGLCRIERFNAHAGSAQEHAEGIAHRLVVVDDEDGLLEGDVGGVHFVSSLPSAVSAGSVM